MYVFFFVMQNNFQENSKNFLIDEHGLVMGYLISSSVTFKTLYGWFYFRLGTSEPCRDTACFVIRETCIRKFF